ncbi:HupE/UreJ family protein [Algibacter sp. 2305UL17-15]|uniref:HupE/UreJ family protein n=1 Tax=Algibacter sp. 2305UL17-15 TaxID=3231268 RepID=UPI00345AFA76
MRKFLPQILLCAFFFLITPKVFAHHPDNSLLYLKIYENANIEGDFHISVNELNDVLGLNLGKRTTVEAVNPHIKKIQEYLIKNTQFSYQNQTYKIVFSDEIRLLKVRFADFVIFNFHLENTAKSPDKMDITFKTFIEEEPQHVNLLGIEYNWKTGKFNNEKIIALDFSNNDWTKTLPLNEGSIWIGFKAMVRQGIWHIWIGIDHILFILALILPAVVRRKRKGDKGATGDNSSNKWVWEPVQKFKPAFLYLIKIITFFTIAHTITLSLASLQIVVLPSRFVESIIALSIGLAAYHNIRPIFNGRDWIIAFVFGLFHGFGFASVLGELGFNGEHLTLSLLGFNVGVEIGQLVIIALIFPVLFLIRKLKLYSKFLVYLSILLIIISLYWLIERVFDVEFPIDNHIRVAAYKFASWLGLV